MKILIDSIYIHNGGGKVLLDILCNKIFENGDIDSYFFLFDERYNPTMQFMDKENYIQISPRESRRKEFYKKNSKDFKRFLCFGNVPPPIRVNDRVDIYFHNDLLLKPLHNNTSIVNKISLVLKKYYIILLNKKHYRWNVQTDIMAKKLAMFFNISKENVTVYPIYDSSFLNLSIKEDNSFIYVSNFSKHKNHKRLFEAFKKASEKIGKRIILNLTIGHDEFNSSFYKKGKMTKNLLIVNHGILNKSKLNKLYNASKYCIFPSLNESFGLPLIEAVLNKCHVICSDKEYAYQVIKPSMTFNPTSIDSIYKAITDAYGNIGLEEPEVLVENKIDTFVKYIQEYV